MRGLERYPAIALLLASLVLTAIGLGRDLWTPDEPRVAAIGRELWEGGTWAVPRLNGEPFLEKPPLYWWAEAAVFSLSGGVSPAAARLPSALFSLGTLLLTWWLGRRFLPPVGCLAAGLVLLTTADFVSTSHRVLVDNALVFAVTGALACYAHSERPGGGRRGGALAGLYTFLCLAFLAKGTVGLGVPLLGIATHLLWTRRLRRFAGWHLLLGGAAVAMVLALWLFELGQQAGGAALRHFLLDQQLGRFLPQATSYAGGHRRPLGYYLLQAPVVWLPWSPMLVLAGLWAGRRWGELEPSLRDGLRLLLATTLPVVVALSLAGTKRALYLDPILPEVALWVGAWMVSDRGLGGWPQAAERGFRALLLGLALVSPLLALLHPGPARAAAWGPALALVLGVWAWRAPPRGLLEQRLATALAVWVLAVNLLLAGLPRLDRSKSFSPFVASLERRVPAQAPLFAFEPDETLLGVVGFYTGRRLLPVDLLALHRLAADPVPHFVVVRDRRPSGARYAALVRSGIPHHVLSEDVIGRRRTLRIVVLGGGAGREKGAG